MAKKKKSGAKKAEARRDLVRHRRARFEYEILESLEAGLVLRGTEVKSLRAGNASLAESFIRFDGDEAFWVSGTIDEYPWGNALNHDPKRKRKLLLKKREIRKLHQSVKTKGLTVIPLAIYLSPRGYLKIEIALVRGKKTHDKREEQKRKQAQRDVRSEMA